MRAIGIDVHRDFCEVAVAENGEIRSGRRIATTPAALELFGQSLGPDDRVALEVTSGAWEIARILEPHVARVIVVSAADTTIRQARAKTDRLDARALARCSRPARSIGSGSPTKLRGCCAGGCRGARSLCASARAARTRSTRS
jgi:Transposase